jgi:hypothetical protein
LLWASVGRLPLSPARRVVAGVVLQLTALPLRDGVVALNAALVTALDDMAHGQRLRRLPAQS